MELTNEQKYLQLKYKLDQSAPRLYNINMYDMSGGDGGLNIQSYKKQYVKTVKYNEKLKSLNRTIHELKLFLTKKKY